MDRRTFLRGLGAAASAGLAGCVRYRNGLNPEQSTDDGVDGSIEEVRIFQTEDMIEALPRNPDRQPIRVFQQYLRRAINDLGERSEEFEPVQVTVQEQPISLDLNQLQAREIEFDQYIQDHPEDAATYSNLLIDEKAGRFEPLGLALCEDCGQPVCQLRNNTTDTAIISGAELTHEVTEFVPSFEAFDPEDRSLKNEQLAPLFGGIHEVGHTLCSIHRDGNAWKARNTPARYEPATDDGVYASTMMGPYVVGFGGEENTRGKTIASFNTRGTESLYYGNLFSDSFVERLDRLLGIDGDFVTFQPSRRRRGHVTVELVNKHTYQGIGLSLRDDEERALPSGGVYSKELTEVGETETFEGLRDGDFIVAFGITPEDEDDEIVQRFEYDGL